LGESAVWGRRSPIVLTSKTRKSQRNDAYTSHFQGDCTKPQWQENRFYSKSIRPVCRSRFRLWGQNECRKWRQPLEVRSTSNAEWWLAQQHAILRMRTNFVVAEGQAVFVRGRTISSVDKVEGESGLPRPKAACFPSADRIIREGLRFSAIVPISFLPLPSSLSFPFRVKRGDGCEWNCCKQSFRTNAEDEAYFPRSVTDQPGTISAAEKIIPRKVHSADASPRSAPYRWGVAVCG